MLVENVIRTTKYYILFQYPAASAACYRSVTTVASKGCNACRVDTIYWMAACSVVVADKAERN